MPGEYNPEYSDIAPRIPSPFDVGEHALRLNPQTRKELAKRALMVDGFTVLSTPESGNQILQRYLRSSIIGQDQAIDAIIDAMDRKNVRLPEDSRPLMTLAFLGPTGVGKSETAKVLANYISGGDSQLVKIDCSNFSHGHEVASLIGSPPGYVGREQEPFLKKKKIERPGVVVLFDEIEKGSPELYNLMLQILGDGQLQLSDGTTTSFRDATIILTSNLGAKEMNEHLSKSSVGFGVEKEEPSKEVLAKSAQKAFKEYFSPEFVNRLDKLVVFNPLDHDALGKVLDNKLAEANEEYVDAYGMAISFTPGTYEHLINKALQERSMGARPLVRAFETDIQTTFGRHLSAKQVYQGSQVQVYHQSEVSQEVRGKFPDSELIFTHRFDEDLWEKHEERKRQIQDAKARLEEERQRRAAKKAAEEALEKGEEPTPPEDSPKG